MELTFSYLGSSENWIDDLKCLEFGRYVRYQDGPQQKCKLFFLEGAPVMCYLHPYLHCWAFLMIFFSQAQQRTAAGRQFRVTSLQRKHFPQSGSCPELIVINGLHL